MSDDDDGPDEAAAFYALALDARCELVTRRLEALREQFDGKLSGDDDRIVLAGAVGRARRRFELRAELEHGTTAITVELTNQIGELAVGPR